MSEKEIAVRIVEVGGVLIRLIDRWRDVHVPTRIECLDSAFHEKVGSYFELLGERARWIEAAANYGAHCLVESDE
ncbi:MAG: hypothetical protein IK077_08620 [Thermoguttaceae bacterium]|nr:hypothetical protein [Thermoguttaceae bacterium]